MHIERLDNGLTLLVDPTGLADVAAIYAWIRVGSADESPGLEGGAHFLEHMVFKGTRSYGVGEVAAAIEGMGGDLNAFTSFDDTAFHCTVPGARAPEAIAVLAEMVREARLDPEELERERKVILEEIRGGEDDPDLVLGEATWAAAFPGHPYGRSIIGTVDSVRGISREALEAFYRRWYQPSNTVLSVAGPVDLPAVREAAQRAFAGGSVVPARAPRTLRPARPAPVVLRRGFEATMADLAFPVLPAAEGPVPLAREAVLDVLAMALSGGRSSPMEQRLRRHEPLCQSILGSLDLERDGGLLTFALHAHAGKGTEALRAAREELARAQLGALPDAEILRARAGMLAGLATRRESVDARASDAASDLVRHGDAEAWRAYRSAVESVRPEDVRAAAREIFDPATAIAVVLAPPRARVDPNVAPRTVAAPSRSLVRGVERHVLANGLTVLLEPTEQEAVGVRLTGMGGLLGEPGGASGRTLAWSRAVTRGAAGLDAHAFACEVEGLGAGLGAAAGRSTQALRGDFVQGNLAGGLELLAEVARHPDFPEEEVERVREELLASLEERDDEPELLASDRLWSLVYGKHPYGAPMGGTRGSLGRLRRGDLARLHARWARPENLILSVSGGFDPESMLRRAQRLFGRMQGAPPLRAAEASGFVRAARPPARARLRTPREQAHVWIAWPGARVAGPEQPAVELLSGVLGGQGGRLFLELREAHGLAYAVGAASHEGWVPGLVIASIATDPARVDEAEARLRASVERLTAAPVPLEEFERARAALLGTAEAELQGAGYRAGAMGLVERYGLDGTGYRTLVKRRLEGLTPETLHAAARVHLSTPLAIVRVDSRGTA